MIRRLLYVLLLAGLIVVMPAVADARWTGARTAAMSVSTDTLTPPSGVRVTATCGFFSPYVSVSWTATSDTYAGGYTLTMTGGGSSTDYAVPGRATTSRSIRIPYYTSVTFTVVAVASSWTSAPSAPTQPVSCGLFG